MRKKDEIVELPPGNSNSGFIRFEVDKISSLDFDGRFSPEVEVGGVNWRANVCKKSNAEYIEDLWVYLVCMQDQKTSWAIDVKSEHILLNADKKKNVVTKETFTYGSEGIRYNGGPQVEYNDMFDKNMGFIKDDKITVEVRFFISNMRGVRVDQSFDFTNPIESFHDVAFVIEGEKIYANKGILAAHSPVFKAMFFGDFKEKNEKEIEMKDIIREEFLVMLRVIYPSRKKITDDSVEYLLKLADRFQIMSLIEDAEDFLIAKSEISSLEMLRIADHYGLHGLLNHIIHCLKKKSQFENIKKSSIYEGLSANTSKLLFERSIQVLK